MDLSSIFSINIILQSLTVGIFVYMIRVWCESKWSTLAGNRKWTGVVLPSLALVVSLLISFLTPIGQLQGQLPGEKLAYALICGFSSSFVFSILKAFLKKQAGLPDSIPPEKNNDE